MNAEKKDVMAYASLLHSNVCDGVVVKLLTTQSTEQVLCFQLKSGTERAKIDWLESPSSMDGHASLLERADRFQREIH